MVNDVESLAILYLAFMQALAVNIDLILKKYNTNFTYMSK